MSDNTPLLHPFYNSVYEGTLSKKTSGRKYGLIIKVLKIHIKSTKKSFWGRPGDKYFPHPLAQKTEALLFFNHR